MNFRTPATASRALTTLGVVVILCLAILGLFQNVRAQTATLNLRDFGAVGDGVTNDGPALQQALDALADAGGGTLFVPQGRYVIRTPVFKNFAGLATTVTIAGVESSTVVDTTGGGLELSQGLDLVSEFLPQTRTAGVAITILGLQSVLVHDISFMGNAAVDTDAVVTLDLFEIEDATIRHCEFYGLLSQVQGGAIVRSVRSGLTIQQSKFLGSSGNSGVYVPVVENLEWKHVAVSETVFLDYGQRPELYSKTNFGAPIAWINIGNAHAVTNDSPRREAIIDTVFLDEGALMGISALPYRYQPPSAPIDLIYISALRMNVSNLGSVGNYLVQTRAVMIEKSRYQWSHNADSAISLFNVGRAIIDLVECVDHADTIRADWATGSLTVINSIYENLASQAQTTKVINTEDPEDDPVQYVRQQFSSVLGRKPDAAAHYYWSQALLQCGDNTNCVTDEYGRLNSYLSSSPNLTFGIEGKVTVDNGASLAGALVTLSGSQSVQTQTDSQGRYSFTNLPTSGNYTVTVSKTHYTFSPASVTITTPAGDRIVDFPGLLNRHTISGTIADGSGHKLSNATVTLTGFQTASMQTDAEGKYSFQGLPAGGTYTITPSKPTYRFMPPGQTVQDLGANKTYDFVATLMRHAIIGKVTNINNVGLGGITVGLTGFANATTTTNASGDFSFPDLAEGQTYTVAPSLKYYSFQPPSQTFTNLSSDRYAGFVLGQAYYSITGRITNPDGSALPGSLVTLSGPQSGSTTSDTNGNYSFSNLLAGPNYLVAVSKANYRFSPSAEAVIDLDRDRQANFTGAFVTYQITGHVIANGAELPGVTVTVSGSQTFNVTTNEDGAYSVSVPAGQSYTVTPSRVNYTFTPSSVSFSNLIANQVAEFSAVLNPGVPVLISHPDSTRALTFDSVLGTIEPFDLTYDYAWSADRRTRLVLFATNFELAPGETAANVSADAQDASGRIYTLTVESIARVPGQTWLNYLVVRLSDDLSDVGDVLLRIQYRNVSSNRVRVGIGHVGGGPADDAYAIPTPGSGP